MDKGATRRGKYTFPNKLELDAKVEDAPVKQFTK
jgi:hypothetical protein